MRRLISFSRLGAAVSLCIIPLFAQISATSFCNTGLTPKSAPATNCLSSVLVSPINPVYGGPIIDGNWQLATPYPSASGTQEAPDPCTVPLTYGPARVNAANPGWYNPDDGLSQWISPDAQNVKGYVPPGWYVYRTAFIVPPAYPGYTNYALEINGRLSADDQVAAIYVADLGGGSPTCRHVGEIHVPDQYQAWWPFNVRASLRPDTEGLIYFIVFNISNELNASGLRVEFTSANYYPHNPVASN